MCQTERLSSLCIFTWPDFFFDVDFHIFLPLHTQFIVMFVIEIVTFFQRNSFDCGNFPHVLFPHSHRRWFFSCSCYFLIESNKSCWHLFGLLSFHDVFDLMVNEALVHTNVHIPYIHSYRFDYMDFSIIFLCVGNIISSKCAHHTKPRSQFSIIRRPKRERRRKKDGIEKKILKRGFLLGVRFFLSLCSPCISPSSIGLRCAQ